MNCAEERVKVLFTEKFYTLIEVARELKLNRVEISRIVRENNLKELRKENQKKFVAKSLLEGKSEQEIATGLRLTVESVRRIAKLAVKDDIICNNLESDLRKIVIRSYIYLKLKSSDIGKLLNIKSSIARRIYQNEVVNIDVLEEPIAFKYSSNLKSISEQLGVPLNIVEFSYQRFINEKIISRSQLHTDYIKKKLPILEISTKYGVSVKAILKLLAYYNLLDGDLEEEPLKLHSSNPDLVTIIIRDISNNETFKEICAKYGMTYTDLLGYISKSESYKHLFKPPILKINHDLIVSACKEKHVPCKKIANLFGVGKGDILSIVEE